MLILCTLGLVLGRSQTSARNEGRTDALSRVMRSAVAPIASPIAGFADWTSDFLTGFGGAAGLRAENRRLREAARAASLYQERLSFLESELASRQALLGLPQLPGRNRVVAAVTGYYPTENRITIGIGENKGIRRGMPAVTVDGLVGTVQTVDKSSAQVLLVTSARFRVGAMVRRDPPPAGLLRGDTPQALILDSLDMEATVQVGDEVVTLGASERIPPGIPIGKVVQLNKDPAFGRVWCQVFPNVQVGVIRAVYILR